jgi:polysaccharide deacetylase family protein (PEP-CTERM system associated)
VFVACGKACGDPASPPFQARVNLVIAPPIAKEIPNVFSVDVEDYFQVSAFEKVVSRKTWGDRELRVEKSTEKILRLLDRHQVRGTFFILGWVARHCPALIKKIHREGHEVASHGYAHQLVYDLNPDLFRADLRKSIDAIASACGVRPMAYRAPSFSIIASSMWALEVLVQEGFLVDSSIFPIRGHDRYGVPNAKRELHRIDTPSGPILEFPPTAWHLGKANVPVGGGYFRIFPLALTRQAIRRVRKSGRPAMFYIHPWEVDPAQPKIDGISVKTRFRHYHGLKHTHRRLDRLLKKHLFASMGEVIERLLPEGTAGLVSD